MPTSRSQHRRKAIEGEAWRLEALAAGWLPPGEAEKLRSRVHLAESTAKESVQKEMAALRARLVEVEGESAHLKLFKEQTHALLDAMGIPAQEDAECRIAARMYVVGAVLMDGARFRKEVIALARQHAHPGVNRGAETLAHAVLKVVEGE